MGLCFEANSNKMMMSGELYVTVFLCSAVAVVLSFADCLFVIFVAFKFLYIC